MPQGRDDDCTAAGSKAGPFTGIPREVERVCYDIGSGRTRVSQPGDETAGYADNVTEAAGGFRLE